jgi:zinc protease
MPLKKSPQDSAFTLAKDVVKKILPNGLTVLVKSVHSAPVVAVNAWVKAGSVDELEPEKGISHFIEHMLFKGTERLAVGQLDRLIKSSGGYNNAHTRYESTDFIDVMPSDRLDIALETMADALRNSTFEAAELDRERLVVLEELSRAQDNPGFEAWNRFTHLAFRRHVYRHPVIGYKERLLAMDRKLLVDYWRRWYLPSNAVLVIVGDVDPLTAHKAAAARFGLWKPGRLPKSVSPAETVQNALRFEESSGAIEGAIAVLGVPSCAELDPDAAALDMGLAVLGQGLSSRLNVEVRERRKLVHTLSTGQFNGRHPGLAYVWAELETHQVPEALKAIWGEIERMRRECVSPRELDRQKVRLEHDDASEAMSMEGMAGKLGYYECLGSDYRLADEDTARLKAVTPEDVRRAMEKYFRPERVNLVVHRSAKGASTGLNAAKAKALLEPAQPAGVPARSAKRRTAPELGRFKLSGGGTLLVRPVRHAPVAAAQFLFPAGPALEGPARAGALNLAARALLKGVPGFDAVALAGAMDDLGMGLGAAAHADSFGVSLQTLSSRVAESFALAGRCLREAELPEAEVAKERARVLKDIKDKKDSPDEYVADLFARLHYGAAHPYGRPLEGDAESVRGLDRESLLELKRSVLRPEGLLAVVVGDVDPAALRDRFEAEFGKQAWKVKGARMRPARFAEAAPGPRRGEAFLPKKQAHIVMGWPCPPVTHPDYPVLRLVNSVLGEGMDSRLFTEVRDKRGLCYSVYSTFDRRLSAGVWRIYVGTQASNAAQAEKVCREVAASVAAEGITAEELAGAKAYAKGIFKVARQDFGAEARMIANYEFWGLGAAEFERVPARLEAVTLEDCRRVARTWIKPEMATVAVVRPRA